MQAPKPYYDHDGITIYHGDCREVLPTLDPVDLIIADPPYGERCAVWDDERPPDAIWDDMARTLIPGGVLYYWGFWQHAEWVMPQARRVGLTTLAELTWWFRTGVPQSLSYRQDAERAWYCTKGDPSTFNPNGDLEPYEDMSNYKRYGREGKHPGTVWIASRIFHNHPQNVGHETQKPLEIISKMIRISSNPGDMILDPFMGSGTTLRAAKDLGRRAIGIEISEEYCAIAVRRLSQSVLPLEFSHASS